MKQAKWLTETDDPYRMLNFLGRKVSSRKARLFACACFRHRRPKLKKWEQRIVDVAERYPDELAGDEELQRAQEESVGKAGVAWAALAKDCWTAVEAARAAGEWSDEAFQCDLIRDIFGNPFNPPRPVSPAVLAWNDGAVPKLARAIYDERAFDQLPILADALEEAGCDDAEVLSHCRGGGEHARGCWVLDLLLNRADSGRKA